MLSFYPESLLNKAKTDETEFRRIVVRRLSALQHNSSLGTNVFIGSSSEGLKIAEQVQDHLHSLTAPRIWNQGSLRIGQQHARRVTS